MINIDKVLGNPKMINELFLDFVKGNANEVLTAVKDDKTPYLYTFKENNTWLFDENYLIKVK